MKICLMCELEKYPPEKLADKDFVMERKNEFYPEEDYGDYAYLCEGHLMQVDLHFCRETAKEILNDLKDCLGE